MTQEKLLSINNLGVRFYTYSGTIRAVDGVDIDIGKSEVVGIVGESGSGKTTLAFAVMRLLPRKAKIVSGSIFFDGKDLTKLEENDVKHVRGKKISMVFQDPLSFLNPVITIGDQIVESILTKKNLKRQQAREAAIELVERVRISRATKIMDEYPHQLSGGMRQRVLIAIAMSSDPSLLIADEPTTALDVTVQAQILTLLKDLSKMTGTSIMLITHDLGIVAETCDRVYVMYAGKIFEYANVVDLFEEPLHPYTAALLDSALSIEQFKKNLVGISGEVPSLINPPLGCRFHPRCSKAKPICYREEPRLKLDEKGHGVYCWLYNGED
jgi:oligopeptide/dipeptide ABC transporter ATP-binding protein